MSESTISPEKQRDFGLTTAVLLILPLILLAAVILLFLNTGGGLQLASPAPVESLTVERTILKPGKLDLIVRNTGPEELTLAQIIINDAIWPMIISPSQTIPRF